MRKNSIHNDFIGFEVGPVVMMYPIFLKISFHHTHFGTVLAYIES